jgi:mediator of RNA polymerase II transcription subunit 30
MQNQPAMHMSQPLNQVNQSPVAATSAPVAPGREFPNAAFLCKVGQESVQDIVSKTTEMFSLLKTLQLPNGTSMSASQQEERKAKCHELLRNISMLFKRLHRIYERCNEYCGPIESSSHRPMIPFEKDVEHDRRDPNEPDDSEGTTRSAANVKPLSDIAQSLKVEYDEQVTLLREKNAQIKKMIDSMRELVWDINTMLVMRK